MIYSTATVPVNPEGETRLTRAQAWAGLELKARDARLFLPPGLCTRCDVVEESATHFVREATIAGADLREIITLEPQEQGHLLPGDRPARRRDHQRTVRRRERRPPVAFLLLSRPARQSAERLIIPEEQAEQAQFDSDKGYTAALLSTLRRTREAARGRSSGRVASTGRWFGPPSSTTSLDAARSERLPISPAFTAAPYRGRMLRASCWTRCRTTPGCTARP
jgi:hypothetical protein